MSFYPVFVELEGKSVVVVGGGNVAFRKVTALLECGAVIHLAGRVLTPELQEMVEQKEIYFLGNEFEDEFLNGAFMVIAATDDKDLNHHVSTRAREKGVLVNAVDQPPDCDFIVPSILRRGDLLIAISTSGKSPAMARKIRKGLETQFGQEYEAFLAMMGRLRKEVLSLGFSQEENSRIFQKIVDADLLKDFSEGFSHKMETCLKNILPEQVNLKNVCKP
ncbi:MAG: bifunctional precorrin-2 dehydrogenase/sirohydrochlorin ferrochelatase [Deltaproteobacteria bacterium]|jgi:precorrin-2 dehydrogenase/sirohydrochlorin ferrochelatase|nr:bifunctional precorrin-2 dehydrogenase/sirohydrochlorin ferrochelatase [Deltaproteobacteria bacterium]